MPNGVDVADALRETGLPLYAEADRANGGVDGCCLGRNAPLPCEQRTVFLDERSHVEPDGQGSAIVDRPSYGGFVEIYAIRIRIRIGVRTVMTPQTVEVGQRRARRPAGSRG